MGEANGWLKPEDSSFLAILRSISIFVIVFGHVGGFWIYPPWSEYLHVFVPVFFFISGTVSYNGFQKNGNIVQYLFKRITSLLIPYYCVCVVALVVFIIQGSAFPEINLWNLFKWITITPSNSIMPFPLGQVWFLHTLSVIVLFSPLLFWLYQRRLFIFVIFICCSICLSAIPIVFNIEPSFGIFGQNLFKPIVHSLFFCIGFIVYDKRKFRSPHISILIVSLCVVLSITLVKILNLNPGYAEHTYSPDIYYVIGSIGAIWLFLLLQPYIVNIYKLLPLFVQSVSHFFFRHTFAIYLLHPFAIYLVENIFGLVHPKEKTVSYGIIKLVLVLLITCLMSPAFTRVSFLVINKARVALFEKFFYVEQKS